MSKAEEKAQRAARIRHLNDQLRQSFTGGRVVLTDGILHLTYDEFAEVVRLVRRFDTFTEDNDPYQEHDFGAVECAGKKIFWKIDYYDKERRWGSEDPTNPEVTTRVLTILLASEY